MLSREIYNNIFNKKANIVIEEKKNIVFTKKFKIGFDYGNEGTETENAEISIIDNGNEKYELILNLKNNKYVKKLKLNSGISYKITKSTINIDKINDFLRILRDSIFFEGFIKKLVKELTGYKYDPYDLGYSIYL